MDISGMFQEEDQNLNDGGGSDYSSGQSAAINVDGLIGASNEDNASATLDEAAVTVPDPLDVGIIPNETVTTNDLSVVGEIKPPEERPEPSVEPFIPEILAPQPEPMMLGSEPADIPEPDSPEKIDFIKTYTAEYDEVLNRATETVQKVLDSVDASIHDKLPDIAIPKEANEFLKKAPTEGKVEKFEEVREIVQSIMDRAAEAKQQSQAAAAEAARIYDEVQAFKKETKQKIADLTQE